MYIPIPFKQRGLESDTGIFDPIIDALQVYTPALIDETCVNVSLLSNVDDEPLIEIFPVIISPSLNHFTSSEEISGPIGLVRLIVHTTDTSSPIL